MKNPVTVLLTCCAPSATQSTHRESVKPWERASRKADLLQGWPDQWKQNRQKRTTNPVNEQKRAAIYEARTNRQKRDLKIP